MRPSLSFVLLQTPGSIQAGAGVPLASPTLLSLPLSKLTRESGTDFPIPAVPPGTDPETERLIREKDEEVRAAWDGRG